MPADKHALRQQILAQIDRCAELAYGAGHHFAQHGKHAPSGVMAKADADAKLIRLIEEYAARGVAPSDATPDQRETPSTDPRETVSAIYRALSRGNNLEAQRLAGHCLSAMRLAARNFSGIGCGCHEPDDCTGACPDAAGDAEYRSWLNLLRRQHFEAWQRERTAGVALPDGGPDHG